MLKYASLTVSVLGFLVSVMLFGIFLELGAGEETLGSLLIAATFGWLTMCAYTEGWR